MATSRQIASGDLAIAVNGLSGTATGYLANSAAGYTGKFFDYQVNGTSYSNFAADLTNGLIWDIKNPNSASKLRFEVVADNTQPGTPGLTIRQGDSSAVIAHNLTYTGPDGSATAAQTDPTNYSFEEEFGAGGLQWWITKAGLNPNSQCIQAMILQYVSGKPLLQWKVQQKLVQDGSDSIFTWYDSTGATIWGDIGATGHLGIGDTVGASSSFWLTVKGTSDNQLRLDASSGSRYTSLYWANNGVAKAQDYWDNTNNTRFISTLNASASLTFGAGTGAAVQLTLTSAGNLTGTGYFQSAVGTATPAGGNANAGVFMGSAGIGVLFGSGAPTVTAPKGSIYLRSDGSATNNRAYINTDGSTTWTALTTAA